MKTIGIKLADGSFYPVLQENIPSEKSLDLTTAHNNQTKVMVDLYRSELCTMEDAEYVDSLEIDGLIAHPNGEPDISFVVSLDDENKLSAKIVDEETGSQSKTTISLVSRTAEERLVTDEYGISDTPKNEMEEENVDGKKSDVAKIAAATAMGSGLLAAAEAMRKKEEEEDKTDVTFTPDGESFVMEENFVKTETAREEPEGREEIFSEEMTSETVVADETNAEEETLELADKTNAEEENLELADETNAEEENPELADEAIFEGEVLDGETETISEEDAPVVEDETFVEKEEIELADDTFSEENNLPDFGDLNFNEYEEPSIGEEISVEENKTISAEDEIIDDSDKDLFATDDTIAFNEDPIATDNPFGIGDTNATEDPFATRDIPNISINDDLPSFDDLITGEETMTDSSNDDDIFADFDESPSPASGLSFTGLYDKETELGDSADYSNEQRKKTKVPVIICIICAIICILATLLILFIIPSKYNLITKKQQESIKIEKEVNEISKVEKNQEEKIPEEKNIEEKNLETSPKTELVPPAKEDEVIIIEKAEAVIPEPPEPLEEKPKNITYKIKWGDTLWDIADTYYKNPWRYKYIARYNGIKNPDYIISGTVIIIPAE